MKSAAVDDEIRFLENLESWMGATRPMPQKVNLGPDRVVDELHSRLIRLDLKSRQPLIATERITRYLSEASGMMRNYMQLKLRDRPGLKACANCYIEVYTAQDTLMNLYDQLSRQTEEECRAYGLDPSVYVR